MRDALMRMLCSMKEGSNTNAAPKDSSREVKKAFLVNTSGFCRELLEFVVWWTLITPLPFLFKHQISFCFSLQGVLLVDDHYRSFHFSPPGSSDRLSRLAKHVLTQHW